jgi:hypothetical protein
MAVKMAKKKIHQPDLMPVVDVLKKAKELMESGRANYITSAIALVFNDQFQFRHPQCTKITIWIGSMLHPSGSLGRWLIRKNVDLGDMDQWEENIKQHSIRWLQFLIDQEGFKHEHQNAP